MKTALSGRRHPPPARLVVVLDFIEIAEEQEVHVVQHRREQVHDIARCSSAAPEPIVATDTTAA